MKYIEVILCAGLFACMSACNSSEAPDAKLEVIPVELALQNPVKLKASDCFHKISYIPLETTDSCLVGRSPAVRLFGDKILVSSAPNQCMVFDRSGRFISSIGHVGDDPEGYSGTNCWIDERTGTLHFAGWNKNLITYQDNGTFRESIPVPESAKKPIGEFEFLGNGQIIQYANDLFGGSNYLLNFKNNEVIKKKEVTRDTDTLKFDMGNIQSVSVLKNEVASESMPVTAGAILLIDFKEPDKGLITMMGNNHLWRIENDVYFKADYNDTIYQVVDTTLIPVRYLELGKHHWEFNDRFDKKNKDGLLVAQILDSKNISFMRLSINVFEKLTSYNAIWDKSTGSLKVGLYKEGLEDDLTHFYPLQPLSVSTSGEYAGLISAEQVLTWFEDNKNSSEISDEVMKLKQVGEEDNPIVIIME